MNDLHLLAVFAGLFLMGFATCWMLRKPRVVHVVRFIETKWALYATVSEQLRTIAHMRRMRTHDVEQIVDLQEQLAHVQAMLDGKFSNRN